jgi:hypothetical protein
VSLHSVQSRPWTSFLLFFEHQTCHSACFNAWGLLYENVFDTLLFSSSYRPIEKPVSNQVVTRHTFLLSFLDHHTSHPGRHDARILLYECVLDALWIFSSLFQSIGSLLPIGRHSTSLRSARLQTGRLLSWLLCFWPTCTLFELSIASRLCQDPLEVAAPTHRSGACETWAPLGPHRPGSWPSPTSGSGPPEDPPT